MELLLTRKKFTKNATIGTLTTNGVHLCATLEPVDRGLSSDMTINEIKSKKIANISAIPKGRYKVIMTYSQKFKKLLPELLDVPAYQGVRIHSGNSYQDTQGCILCGYFTQPDLLIESRQHTQSVVNVIKKTIDDGDEVYITIE